MKPILFPILTALLLIGCSHSKEQRYSRPNPVYEPVYLTVPPDPAIEKYRTDDYLVSQFDRNLNGSPESQYAKEIDSATLTATEEFWVSEGYVPESMEYRYIADSITSYDTAYPTYDDPYLYEWYEWSQIRPPSTSSFNVYVYSYDPHFDYWYDPYWSRSRVYSYHAPLHYPHRYLHGYGFYPYHYHYLSYYHHYYYYPVNKPKKREEYVAEQPRNQRTGVRRNASPSMSMPLPTSSVSRPSTRTRLLPSARVQLPSMDRIFTSPQRQSIKNQRRTPGIFSKDRTGSSPRIHIQTNKSSNYRTPKASSYKPPSRSPVRSMPRTSRPSSGRSGSYTKPSR